MPLKQKQLQLCKYGPESGSCHCSDSLDKEVWTAEIRTQVYLAIWLLKQWPGFYDLPLTTPHRKQGRLSGTWSERYYFIKVLYLVALAAEQLWHFKNNLLVIGIQDVIPFVFATGKNPGIWQLSEKPGNRKMLSLASGQNSNNLPKLVRLRRGWFDEIWCPGC